MVVIEMFSHLICIYRQVKYLITGKTTEYVHKKCVAIAQNLKYICRTRTKKKLLTVIFFVSRCIIEENTFLKFSLF